MKKLIKILLMLIIVYFGLSGLLNFFSKGHNIEYNILLKNKEININEKLVKNVDGLKDYYYFKINSDDYKFEYQLNRPSKKQRKIINDVKFIKDKQYSCMLPIFSGNNILTDIICKDKNNIYYNYSSLNNVSNELLNKANNLSKNGYIKSNYIDKTYNSKRKNLIKIYPDNKTDDLYFGITNYKGLYLVNGGTVTNVKLFNNDVYKREISFFVSKYYVTANYNEKYDFNVFYLVDMIDGSKTEVNSPIPIANDSYISGIVDDSIYIVDKSGKRQFELDVDSKLIKEVGNEELGMLYYNQNKWETVPVSRMTLNETYFKKFTEVKEKDYILFNKDETYSYYYKKNDNKYRIYRSSINNSKIKIYLFTTTDLSSIKITNNYFVYKENNDIHYYSDISGNKTLLTDSELEFNKDILYGIYEK